MDAGASSVKQDALMGVAQTQRLADLEGSPALDIAQHQHRALAGREPVHGGADRFAQFLVEQGIRRVDGGGAGGEESGGALGLD